MKLPPFNDIGLTFSSEHCYSNPLVGLQRNLTTALDLMEVRLFYFNSIIEAVRVAMIPVAILHPAFIPFVALAFFDYLMIILWPGVAVIENDYDRSIEVELDTGEVDGQLKINEIFFKIDGVRRFRYNLRNGFSKIPDFNVMGYVIEDLIKRKRLNYLRKKYVKKYLEPA